MKDNIIIKGAREHNLKDIDVVIPRNKLSVITGLSGSGKSTLAFDTIYAEGQRRYVESLSAYARQFLGIMNKPDVDSIDGLSPAISIEQKTTSKNPRSTVGTVTEIYDYLRLLFARIGTPYCPTHNLPIQKKTPSKISKEIAKTYENKTITILAQIISQKKGTHEKLIQDLNKEGYVRCRVDGKIIRTDEKVELERYKMHDIDVVIDRVNVEEKDRLSEAVEKGLVKGNGIIKVLDDIEESSSSKTGVKNLKIYSSKMSCPECDVTFEELQPRMFSFNSPFGACPECHGIGFKLEIDPELVIPDKSLSIAEGAIAAYKTHIDGWRRQQLNSVGRAFGFSVMDAIEDLNEQQLDILLYGSDRPLKFSFNSWSNTGYWEGLINQLERLYQQTESDARKVQLEKFMRQNPCKSCNGKRLKPKILSVKINDKNIIEVTDLSIKYAIEFFKNLKLDEKEMFIAKQVLKEINERLKFLNDVGLSYLTMSRSAGTLSGGEAQRIRLATQIGSNLMGVLYVLDEPSIGLHQKDNNKLISTLHKLRDIGNTLVVVEHDEDTIMNADHVIDIGPGAGIHGGKVIAEGTPNQVKKNKKSLTGKYLNGDLIIPIPENRRSGQDHIEIIGASQNNLKNVDVNIPLKTLTCVTGVSGSGKSTLIYDILYKEMMKKIYKSKIRPGKHKQVNIPKEVDKVIMIDQSPIGKTPRSNPVTYIKVFDHIRTLYSMTKEAKLRGYEPGRFSFNVKGGRCEACQGDGLIKIEMNFLPDVYVQCEECKGKRYNEETLEVTYKGKTISDVLDMSVEEALSFFENIPTIKRKLQYLFDVGLGYIKLGQSSTTLSGGEAQRIKLTKELSKVGTGNTLYLLDEPTTGLHFHDVNKLIDVLNRLVDKGNTIVVIEHNLDVIKCADHIIDLGPEGGDEGGKIIFTGTPEEIIKYNKSFTGKYLNRLITTK